VTGDEYFKQILKQLMVEYQFSSELWNDFVHTGVHFSRREDGAIIMSQSEYIESIDEFSFMDGRPLTELLDQMQQTQLRAAVGAIMWVAGSTRPDVSADVGILSGKLVNPTMQEAKDAMDIVRNLKKTAHQTLVIAPLQEPINITVHTDSAFQNLANSGTQAGFLITVTPDFQRQEKKDEEAYGKVSAVVIGWKSAKIRRVVRSTFGAELMECLTAFDEAARVREMLEEIIHGKKTREQQLSNTWTIALDIKTDCKSLLDHLKSLRMYCEEKKLFGAVDMLREAVKVSEVRSVQHVKTEHMVADGLTKPSYKLKGAIIDAMNGFLVVPLNWRNAAHGVGQQRVETMCVQAEEIQEQ
jgi:hypothetical protein